jgi:hypothetical protein
MKRSIALVALAMLGLLGLASPAHAAEKSSNCQVWASPITIKGHDGSVTVTSCSTPVGIAVYVAPGAKFDLSKASEQILLGAQFVQPSTKPQTISVTVPDCYYQLDVFTGSVIPSLSPANLYGSRLLTSATGGTKSCLSETTTSTTSTTVPKTTTTTAAPHIAAPVTTTTAAPKLTSQALAVTGVNLTPFVIAGGLLTIVGMAMLGVCRKDRSGSVLVSRQTFKHAAQEQN